MTPWKALPIAALVCTFIVAWSMVAAGYGFEGLFFCIFGSAACLIWAGYVTEG